VGQLDAILGMVNRALRAHLESRVMAHREYQSELFRGIFKKGVAEGKAKGVAEGKAKGVAEGKARGVAEGKARGVAEGKARGVAEGILIVLKARGVPVNEAIRRRVLACTNLRTLDAWLRRASVAETAAAVVGLKAPPRAPARRGKPRAASAVRAERKQSAAGAETKKSTGTRRAPHRP
jgi:ribosomal protein L12E/L44/L45/RPP1/RPP2